MKAQPLKTHVWLDLWRGTDGFMFYSTYHQPVLERRSFRTKVQFEFETVVVHVWSREDFTYRECHEFLHKVMSGHTRPMLVRGKWIE